jgi:hypothetical protein
MKGGLVRTGKTQTGKNNISLITDGHKHIHNAGLYIAGTIRSC